MVQEISRIIHKSRAKKQTCKRPVSMKDSQPSLGRDQSSQPLPQFRKPTASPYLGGPVSCESVRWCRAAGPAAERSPERWRAGAACSHRHTRTPSSSRTATCRSPRSADSECPSRSCANTWKGAEREEEEMSDNLKFKLPSRFPLVQATIFKHVRKRACSVFHVQLGRSQLCVPFSGIPLNRMFSSHWIARAHSHPSCKGWEQDFVGNASCSRKCNLAWLVAEPITGKTFRVSQCEESWKKVTSREQVHPQGVVGVWLGCGWRIKMHWHTQQ